MFGKPWHSTNGGDISDPATTPIIWKRSKQKCLRALESANNSMILEKCHFKETNNSMQIEPISKSVACIHKTTSQTAKLTCNDKMKIINLIAGSNQLQMNADCILENNNEAIFLGKAEQNDEETFQLSIELRSNSLCGSNIASTPTDEIKMTFSLTLAYIAVTLIACLYIRIGILKIAMLYCNSPAKTNSYNNN